MADSDGIDHAQAKTGLREGLADHGDDGFDVGAAGNLGDDAGVLLVEGVLAGDDAGADEDARLDDGGGGLIAGRFDAEDEDGGSGKKALGTRHLALGRSAKRVHHGDHGGARRRCRDWGLGTGHRGRENEKRESEKREHGEEIHH
jgi:hypothetical protein